MPRISKHPPSPELELQNIFAQNLRRALNDREMSQTELAESLCVNKAMVCRWLNGSHAPTITSVARISNELGIDPSSLFNRRNVI